MKNSQKLRFIKVLLITGIVGLANVSSFAQVEVKLTPIGVIFNQPKLSIEYIIAEDIGIQGTAGVYYGKIPFFTDLKHVEQSGYLFQLSGKYYFKNTEKKADRFYIGLYGGAQSREFKGSVLTSNNRGNNDEDKSKLSSLPVGFMAGFKWLGERGLLLDVSMGFGRMLNSQMQYNNEKHIDDTEINIDAFTKIELGYRF